MSIYDIEYKKVKDRKTLSKELLKGISVVKLTCHQQMRARLRRRIQAIFPARDDGTSTKRSFVVPSEVDEDVTAIALLRKININPLKEDEKTKKTT